MRGFENASSVVYFMSMATAGIHPLRRKHLRAKLVIDREIQRPQGRGTTDLLNP